MHDVLASTHRTVLDDLAWSKALLAFDFDGTLAPIVPEPDQARMRQTTRGLLQILAQLYPVVVISGRGQLDASKRLSGVGVAAVVGNHGIERWDAGSRHVSEVAAWQPALEAAIGSLRGVAIEDKIFSVAVHYRQSREKKKARALILQAAASLGDVRVIGGKQVVNILPRDAPHKGIALERERERLGCDTALYVGDDETDEDVFGLDQPGRLLTVRVGAKRTSAATYSIANQRAIDGLLRVLIECRRRQTQRREATK